VGPEGPSRLLLVRIPYGHSKTARNRQSSHGHAHGGVEALSYFSSMYGSKAIARSARSHANWMSPSGDQCHSMEIQKGARNMEVHHSSRRESLAPTMSRHVVDGMQFDRLATTFPPYLFNGCQPVVQPRRGRKAVYLLCDEEASRISAESIRIHSRHGLRRRAAALHP